MNDDKIKKSVKGVVGNVGYIITGLIVIGFILFGLIVPEVKNQNIMLILLSSASMLGLGLTLNSVLPIQALLDGEKHENVKNAKQRVNQTYEPLKPYTQYTDAYALIKNKKALKQIIENKLRKELLSYDKHFNSDGTFKYDSFLVINENDNEFIVAEKERKNKLLEELSKGLKYTQITRADVLAQDEATDNDPNRRADTEKTFLVKQFRKNVAFKILSAVFGGMFGASFAGLAWGDIIYRLIWSIILVSFAFLGYMRAYRYKTIEYPNRLRQSAEWQEEMLNMINNGELEEVFEKQQEMFYKEEIVDENNTDENRTIEAVCEQPEKK